MVLDAETGDLLEYRHLMKRPKYRVIWGASFRNEIGQLAQGMKGRVDGTDTVFLSTRARSQKTDGKI